jgi:hypothetical protein
MAVAALKRFARGLADPTFRHLEFRHRAVITGIFLLVMLLTVPLWYVAGELLAALFAIDTSSAIRDQKGGWWWFGCWIVTVGILISLAWLMALSAVAYRAYRRGELTGEEARVLALYAEYPRHWWKDHAAKSDAA